MTPAPPPIWQYIAEGHQWFQHHQLEAWGGLAALFVGGLLLKKVKRQSRQGLTSHGSARWSTAREVRRAGLSRTHGVVLGKIDGQVWMDDRDTHLLLLAPTRSGKDTFHINPTLHWGWTQSALVFDPKDGETYDATAQARAQYGRVEAFAPYRSPMATVNILDTLRLRTPAEFGDALLIGQSLTAPEKTEHKSSAGTHFRELAALTIAAASLHCAYTTSHASLAAVWHFLTQQQTFAQSLKVMQQTAHTSYGVHQAIAEMSRLVSNIGSDEEMGSVWSTTLRPLMLYLDPYVAASTDTSTVELDDLQYGPTSLALYLLAPSPRALTRLHPIYRVIVEVAMARLMEHKPGTYRQRLLVSANELPSYGYIHAINKGAADMGSYGIKGWFIAQDLKQLDDIYGEDSDLWTNTECKLFHTPANDKAAKRISDNFLGKETVEYLVASQQGRGRQTLTPHRVGRPLMTTEEVGQLDPAQLIVVLRGQRPMLMQKYGYDRRFLAA